MNWVKLVTWEFRYCAEMYGIVRTMLCIIGRLVVDLLRPEPRVYYRVVNYAKWGAKERKRVLLLSSDNTQGSGAFRCFVGLAQELRDHCGYEVLAVIPCQGNGTQLLEDAKIPYECIRSDDWVLFCVQKASRSAWTDIARIVHNHFAVRNLQRLIRDYNPDIVHSNTIFTYVGSLAALLSGVPFVWHIRESLNSTGNVLLNENTSYELMSRANRIIAISDWIKHDYANHILPDKMSVVHDGVDPERFYRPNHKIVLHKPLNFIFTGNFQYKKCQLEFSRACAELFKSGCHDFRVWFVGKGIKEKCGGIFEEAGMSDLVTYHGFQKEPVKFLEQADVAFMCSRAEAFGLVTVEAMLAGCLVIGSNTACTPELIKHGETGLLFDFHDGECPDLVAKMRYAIEHPEVIRRMAEAGRELMLRTKTLECNAEAVSKIYAEVLANVTQAY